MITEMMREPLAKTIKYVNPVKYESAKGLVAQVYDQLQTDFIPAPLIALHSPVPAVMAGAWSMLRETLMAGQVNRSYKEAVAATVSRANECPFCVDAHTVMLRATSDDDVANAILQDDHERIQDPSIRALVQWIWANRTSNPSPALPLPFSQSEMPEIVGTALTFHYLNRMANIFLGDSLLPFSMPSTLKTFTYRLYAATEGKRVVRTLPSGKSLKFLPEASLPDDLSWAAGNPAIAGALAGLATVIEDAGIQTLPESVRLSVKERVRAWNGEDMGLSRQWVEEAVSKMETEHRAAARLALLTAFASYQVDAEIVDAFRAQHPDDAQLIAATAWASFTAARRAGEWLAAPLKIAVQG
ncbi:MAG TPA: carboxymuconolactone decarboxylase family protein [Anaerolineales bacterium]|nr:carboxymuconolactone decarboxylase family protein [Anaerolineales bacterium]